jgi:hypothetical protein
MAICLHCKELIHLATDAEKAGIVEADQKTWKHDSGFWYCQDEAGNEAEPGPTAGRTLADFAGSDKLFKRPMHKNAYGFQQYGGQLREISTSEAANRRRGRG